MDRTRLNKRLIFWYFILWVFVLIALYLSYGVYFLDTTSTKSKWVGLFAGVIAILLASFKVVEISFGTAKNAILEKVSSYFSNGVLIFSKRIFKVIFFVFFILSILFAKMGIQFITCFIVGGIFASLSILVSGYATSKTATRSSQFYAESNSIAYKQLFNSGVIVACCAVGFAIIPLVILFHIFKDYQIINGFVLGAAIVSILNNVATATTKQAVDSASDVVVGFVAEIKKKDRRNPLLLLNGIAKSILEVNILSSDLFVSFVAIIVGAMTLGGEFLQLMGAFLPIIIAASGIFASVLVILLTNVEKSQNPVKTLFVSMFCSNIILIAICYYLIKNWYPEHLGLIFPIIIGAIGGYFVCFSHSNLTFSKYKPILNVANSAISGVGPTIRQTFKESMGGVFAPGFILTFCLITSFLSCGGVDSPSIGLYGIMLAILTSVSSVGIMIGINTFGLTTSSVDTVLETYEEDICDNRYPQSSVLSTTGQYIVSLGKNYINSMTILAGLTLIIAYTLLAGLEQVDILNPYVMGSILIGATVPFLYCATSLGIVSKAARRLVLEVKSQIKKAPQILRYEMRPDYEKCVEISAINSSIQVIINTLFVVLIGIYIAIKLNEEALCGYIFGIIISAFGLIFFTSGTSIVAKTAKKYFENQFSHIKNTNEFEAINLNEAVFSSLKDVIVPSLNSLVKFLAILALALVPLFVK